jgi:hypothetical protein
LLCCDVNETPTSDKNQEEDSADVDGKGFTPLGDQLEHVQLQQLLDVTAPTKEDADEEEEDDDDERDNDEVQDDRNNIRDESHHESHQAPTQQSGIGLSKTALASVLHRYGYAGTPAAASAAAVRTMQGQRRVCVIGSFVRQLFTVHYYATIDEAKFATSEELHNITDVVLNITTHVDGVGVHVHRHLAAKIPELSQVLARLGEHHSFDWLVGILFLAEWEGDEVHDNDAAKTAANGTAMLISEALLRVLGGMPRSGKPALPDGCNQNESDEFYTLHSPFNPVLSKLLDDQLLRLLDDKDGVEGVEGVEANEPDFDRRCVHSILRQMYAQTPRAPPLKTPAEILVQVVQDAARR